MSYGSSLDAKELVRQAVDIVDLVGSFIQLRRQGRIYVGLCPWHDDSRPSLQVNPERQSFKCWVCNIGGDVFSFLQRMEGISFPEALTMLAERAGIDLKPAEKKPTAPAGSDPTDKRTLYQAMAWAVKQYHDCLLNAPDAEPARKYLTQRGLTLESIARFQLGFAPMQRDWLLGRIERNPQRAKILEAVGILARSPEGGQSYDRFRGRALFTIRDAQGRPVGIGGRLLPESGLTSPAKYVNSPETPLFAKSKLLYGLDLARDAIRRKGRALVMEGYTDVIVAHQCGFAEAVAVLGTALGSEHIKILKHYTSQVVLVLDGDEAGQKRTKEVLGLFLSQNADLRVLTLPEGLDPCDYLQKYGSEALAALLETNTVDALEHAFASETRGLDVDRDTHAASEALERLVNMVAQAPRLGQGTTRYDRLREEKTLQRMAQFFRVDEQEVRRRLTALRRKPASTARPARIDPGQAALPAGPPEPLDPWRRELLELLVAHPELWPNVRAALEPDQLATGPGRPLCEACFSLLDDGQAPTFERLMLALEDPASKSLLVELDERWRERQEKGGASLHPDALLAPLLESFLNMEVTKQRPATILALREGRLDTVAADALTAEIFRQEALRHQRSRQGSSKPTEG